MKMHTALIVGTVLSVLAVAAIGWLNGYPSGGVNWTGESWSSLWITVTVIYFACLLCVRWGR